MKDIMNKFALVVAVWLVGSTLGAAAGANRVMSGHRTMPPKLGHMHGLNCGQDWRTWAMARKLRLEFSDACYHVINGGNYRRDWFARDGARRAFRPLEPGMGHRFDRFPRRIAA